MSKYIYIVGEADNAQGNGVYPLMALTSKKDLIEWVNNSSYSAAKKEGFEFFRAEDSIFAKEIIEIDLNWQKGEI